MFVFARRFVVVLLVKKASSICIGLLPTSVAMAAPCQTFVSYDIIITTRVTC
jgi:hypothetical protein